MRLYFHCHLSLPSLILLHRILLYYPSNIIPPGMDGSGYCKCGFCVIITAFDYLAGDAKWKRQKLCQEIKELQSTSGTVQQPSKDMSYSPISWLPRDVFAEIFVQCLPEVILWPRLSGLGHSTRNVAPLLLCNVCSSWRALALSTPRLWQDLSLTFTKTMPKSKSKEETIAMTHVWIKRSGELPLTLRLRIYLDGDFQALCQALVNAITSYTSRWEHVAFDFADSPISLPPLGNMPCLRTFTMLVLKDTQFPFASCPKLASIFWASSHTLSLAPLPWHQLIRIHLTPPLPTRELLFIIQSCSKLTDFRVALRDDVHESLPYEMVINKSLRELQLHVHDICNPLLERLTLPALIDISFDFTRTEVIPVPGFQEELLRFFSRSKYKLKQFVLDDCGFEDVELLECLKHDSCASLMDLRISNMQDTPMFTDAVLIPLTDIPSAENNVLLPKLKHLSLDLCLDGSPSRLGTMILSRRIPFHKQDQLQYLDIQYTELDERDIYLLQLAESLGLDVTLDVEESIF